VSKNERISAEDIPDPRVEAHTKLAVFDFDGTCIAGKSPLLLTLYLLRHRKLNLGQGVLIGLWGLAYKLHIPFINQGWVRGMVFKAFKGMKKAEADQYMHDFYDKKIAGLFRPELEQAIRQRKQEGCVVMVVSASFEPIIDRMMQFHPFDYQISTRMIVDAQGRYTDKVEGLPIEGAEKVAAIRRFANDRFGQGSWGIEYAYSDHYSDRPLLYAARNAFAVAPDRVLTRTAKEEGWPIIAND
jgi:HAD superfamily hydrolase (TIGR01490 family)